MKKFLIIIGIFSLYFCSLYAQQPLKYEKWEQPFYFRGFCISDWNNLEDVFVTQEEFDELKAIGANLAIIQSGGTFDETPPYSPNVWYSEPGDTIFWQDVLDSMVTFAQNAEIYYVISIRTGPGRFDVAESDSSTIWKNVYEQELYGKMLKDIAKRYLPDSLFIGFDLTVEPNPLSEILGEPVTLLDSALIANGIDVNLIYTLWIDSVRTVAPDLPLMVEGVHWSNPVYFSLVSKQLDNKIVYKTHCYNPDDYSHAENPFVVTYPGTFWSITLQGSALFDKLFLSETVYSPVRNFQQANNVPILIGEFGLNLPQNGGEKYLSDIMSIAENYGWHFSLWNWNNTAEFNYPHFDQAYGTHYMDSILIYLNRQTTSIKNSNLSNSVISNFLLVQNYPNPFNPTTAIKYQIPELNFVTIKVYDVLGNEIATLVNEEKQTDIYKVNFYSENLVSGIYFYKLQANEFAQVKKMILLK